MATYNSDNYDKVSYAGEYGNKSFAHAAIASVGSYNGGAGLANGDQVNLFQIPAGAKSLEGFITSGLARLQRQRFLLASSTRTALRLGAAPEAVRSLQQPHLR